ncbi:hypothetical protein F4776DRAFT_89907 [Hypoxylon sp. NC0597]|nr:hypothetical protein F4776DRAFT_89907 [Hypoxylon sp. NC0597]
MEELQLWKYILSVYVERCRTWSHRKLDSEYVRAGAVPLTVENDAPFLCTCGHGGFSPNFFDMEGWDELLRCAVCATISPPFYDPFDADRGVVRGKAENAGGLKLDRCAGCQKVKHCSRECQKADWKDHKIWSEKKSLPKIG